MGRFSRFVKKFTKPVAKVFDKIIPNEIKPALPYLAAFAPMLAPTTGFMGSMMGRALLSGGANIGAQLAQEGNEGDINALSALMASGIGALSAPGSTGGRTLPDGSGGSYSQVMGGDKLASVGNQSAGNYLRDLSNSGGIGDKALNFLGKGADKLSGINAAGAANPFSMDGLKAAALPFAQGTGDVMYAEGTRALKDYEIALRDYENSLEEGQFASDSGRRAAIINAMTGNHTQEVIDQTLAELGLRDGGRVNAMGGGIMSNQRGLVNQPGGYAGLKDAATNTILHEFGSKYDRPTSSGDSLEDKITEEQLSDVLKYDFQGPAGVMGLEESLNMITPESVSRSAMKMQRDGDLNFDNMNKNEPDFNDMPKVLENVKTAQVEEVSEIVELDDLSKLEGFAEMLSNMDESDPKYNEIRNMGIAEAEMVGEKYQISPVDLVGYLDTKTDMFKEKTTEDNKKEVLMESIKNTSFGFADGGVTSVLPEGMEMDYRGGGFIPMGSKERADDVPARVSKNEFVMTADAVRAAGGGSINQGAKKMYEIMNNLEARA